jgi:hypothetical protein
LDDASRAPFLIEGALSCGGAALAICFVQGRQRTTH